MGIFSKVSRSKLPMNVFKDLSYSNKFDAQIGFLYPVHLEEIVPGDIFNVGHGAFVRTQPMVTPVFHNFNYEVRWFFVPNRLVWENFESFITDQEKGHKELGSDHVHPYLGGSGSPMNYLHDLMGIAPLDGDSDISILELEDYISAGLKVNALPFRAYNLIWNEYFKDENVMDDVPVSTKDGEDNTDFSLLRVSWKKDYFTSALPFAQRGDPVQFIGNVVYDPSDDSIGQILRGSGIINWENSNRPLATLRPYTQGGVLPPSPTGPIQMHAQSGSSVSSTTDYGQVDVDPNGTLKTSIPFSAIRRATALQRFLERSALGGNRYAELLLAHFGVRSSDKSLQRPQYLGGGRLPINISPVEQNSGTTNASPQGNLAGKGVGIGSIYFNRPTMFTEHGWLVGLAYIRPDADYCNGIRRQLIKEDRFDYFWPDFQNIGEQEIMNYELYAAHTEKDNFSTFGYQSRYAHYKWHGNEIHGQFRSSLRSWVAPREFSTVPTLGTSFIQCNLDISNNMAVSPLVYPPFMVEALNVVQARRPMYYFNRGVL